MVAACTTCRSEITVDEKECIQVAAVAAFVKEHAIHTVKIGYGTLSILERTPLHVG